MNTDGFCGDCGDWFHDDDCGGYNPECSCGCGRCRSCCGAATTANEDDAEYEFDMEYLRATGSASGEAPHE